jgi:hypothetical protein
MSAKTDPKQTAQMLKALKEQHAETVAKSQERLKEQQRLRKQLKAVMKTGPFTIPEIAEAADLPSDVVLWHVVAMKKYDLVEEVGQAGDFYQYALAGKKESGT